VGPRRYRRARRDAVVRAAAGAALWLAVLAVAFGWAVDGGVQDLGSSLGSWPAALTSVGRLAGLLAAVLLLAQVLLMARVPALEGAFGQDRLARLHRLVGFTSVTLLAVHIATIVAGYAGGDAASLPATFWDMVTSYPGVLLAAAGTVCLGLATVTSVRAARSRLRYESWHLLHLYAYLGVGLAIPHQLWTGQLFVGSAVASVLWWAAWALAAASLLVWRLALPLWRSARHRLRVTSVVPEADGAWSVYLTGRHLDRLPVEAGQFFTWRFPGRPGWTRGHPYSLSAAPDGRSLRITVQVPRPGGDDGSADLATLRPGTPALIEGPYGRLTDRARTRDRVPLVGAGIGVTPLRALAEGMAYAPGDAVLLLRFRDRPLFQRELAVLAEERGLQVVPLPGPRRDPGSWLGSGVGLDRVDDAQALLWWVPDVADRDVYVCGPAGWTERVRRTAEAAGVPASQIHVEVFAW
jgi:predicted ferric reductase